MIIHRRRRRFEHRVQRQCNVRLKNWTRRLHGAACRWRTAPSCTRGLRVARLDRINLLSNPQKEASRTLNCIDRAKKPEDEVHPDGPLNDKKWALNTFRETKNNHEHVQEAWKIHTREPHAVYRSRVPSRALRRSRRVDERREETWQHVDQIRPSDHSLRLVSVWCAGINITVV